MKFATSKPHRDFFHKNGWIEFDDLLSEEQLSLANQAIDQVLEERLKISKQKLSTVSAEVAYAHGRDLWRSHSGLKKIAVQTKFGEITAELIETKPLRLGNDQVFIMPEKISVSSEPSVFSDFLNKTISLEEASCLHGVVSGVVFALNDGNADSVAEKASEQTQEGIDVFPVKAGNAIFFRANVQVNWHCLSMHTGQRFYMIVYTESSSFYRLQPKDPHTHALKRLGYVFNDRLLDKLNPIVCR